jgi:lysozyme
MTGRTSWIGEKQIVCREALVTVAYRDGGTDAKPRYSIGCGSQTGSPKPGDTITIIEAFRLLRHDLDERDAQLNRLVKAELSQQEWDALASLHYQAGFRASRPIAALFNRDRTLVPDAFMAWSFGSAGLLARRKREVAILEHGDYGDVSKYKLYDGDPRRVSPVLTNFPTEQEVENDHGQT